MTTEVTPDTRVNIVENKHARTVHRGLIAWTVGCGRDYHVSWTGRWGDYPRPRGVRFCRKCWE